MQRYREKTRMETEWGGEARLIFPINLFGKGAPEISVQIEKLGCRYENPFSCRWKLCFIRV